MTNVKFITPSDVVELADGSAPGVGFFLSEFGLKDWYSGADSKSAVHERPQSAGAFGIGTDWLSSLAISVVGHFDGDSLADAVAAAERLSSLSGGVSVRMVVADPLRTTSRVVSVRRVTLPDDVGAFESFTFSIDMVAADPLRYGDPVSSSTGVPVSGGGLLWPLGTNPAAFWDWGADGTSGRLSIANVGTADVWPLLTVSGGLSGGFVVTDVTSGGSVRFVRPIPEGSSVTVNQRTGSASIDGQSDVGGFITERGFFVVPAGETHQIQFSGLGAVSGTPQFTVTLSPGYL